MNIEELTKGYIDLGGSNKQRYRHDILLFRAQWHILQTRQGLAHGQYLPFVEAVKALADLLFPYMDQKFHTNRALLQQLFIKKIDKEYNNAQQEEINDEIEAEWAKIEYRLLQKMMTRQGTNPKKMLTDNI